MTFLVVPVHLDALWLEHDRAVVEPMADASRLPYRSDRDVGADVAPLSEEILSHPLQDRSLVLKAGLHLHWALPDALTRGRSEGGEVRFPAVPTRWLVVRTDPAGSERRWIVESDHLAPPGQGGAGVAFPYRDDDHPQPFRRLGRALPFEAWRNHDGAASSYLPHLTAVGYGEPNFAAFYPNCHSVFGFHDPHPPGRGARYDLVGWYGDPAQDVLRADERLAAARERGAAEFYRALAASHAWTVPGIPDEIPEFVPERLLCFARLELAADAPPPARDEDEPAPVAVALGTTGAEALSAFLAHTLDGEKPRLEDQLEALHLAPALEGRTLDLGFAFREARHTRGFTPRSAGSLWTVRTETPPTDPSPTETGAPAPTPDHAPDPARLPAGLARELDDLNRHQRAYDRARHELASRRTQTYADWSKYLICAYPPENARDAYPDRDELADFIAGVDLAPVTRQERRLAALEAVRRRSVRHLHRAVAELQLLEPGDLGDAEAARAALTDSVRTPALEHLWTLLPAPLRERLERPEPLGAAGANALVAALDGLLRQRDFHRAAAFADVPLPTEGRTLRAQLAADPDAPSDRTLRLHRLLIEALLPGVAPAPLHVLQQLPAPRYWQPTDPVVLIHGPDVQPTPRHGADGRQRADGHLEGRLVEAALPDENAAPTGDDVAAFHAALREALDELDPGDDAPGDDARIGFTRWTGQPWHPFLLEWLVEVLPLAQGGNGGADGRYRPDFVTASYELADAAVDLDPKPGRGALARAASIYRGRSILLPHARAQLADQLETLLARRLLPPYYRDHPVDPAERTDDFFARHRDEVLAWFDEAGGDLPGAEPLAALVRVHRELAGGAYGAALTQSLGGFNEALLMHEQTLQLPVDDPLGFDDHRAFGRAVARAVGTRNRSAPRPLADFHPIRNGALKLLELRLVDTFGQSRTLLPRADRVVAAEPLAAPGQPHLVALRPRITQPARLDVRWLAAGGGAARPSDDHASDDASGERETNAHPATGPVCGWFLPNLLDGSLIVHDAGGAPLGSVDRYARWEPAPGRRGLAPGDVADPHLRGLVRQLLEEGPDFFEDFLTAVASALETIDPDAFVHHEALALLVGRPVAVVRARLRLELQGLPAVHQGWDALHRDMERFGKRERRGAARPRRDSAGFTRVRFPVRLGEVGRLHDGLVGYWTESGGRLDPTFYAPQTPTGGANASIDHPRIRLHRDGLPVALPLAVDDPPRTLTLLMDPRGALHVTSGILPTKALTLPAEPTLRALRRLEATFLTAPLLVPEGRLELPLPQEPGFDWTWLERHRGGWSERPVARAGPRPDLARQALVEGWLKLAPHRNADPSDPPRPPSDSEPSEPGDEP